MTSGITWRLRDEKQPTWSTRVRSSANAATSRMSASIPANTPCERSASNAAAAVGRTLRPVRSNRATPVARSSADMCWETAEAE